MKPNTIVIRILRGSTQYPDETIIWRAGKWEHHVSPKARKA